MKTKVFFTEWMIKSLKKYPEYKDKVMNAVLEIYTGERGSVFRPLKHSNLLKHPLDKNFRIIGGRRKGKGHYSYIFLDMGSHDIYRHLKFLEKRFESLNPNDLKEITQKEVKRTISEGTEEEYLGVKLFRVNENVLCDKNAFDKFLRNEYDKYLNLTDKQEKIVSLTAPGKVVTGKAGTGKTVLILYQALKDIERSPDIPKILVTYSPDVSFIFRNYIRKIFQSDPEMLNVYIYSFDSFVSNYLKRKIMDTVNSPNFGGKNNEDIRKLLELENLLDDYESLCFFEEYLQSKNISGTKPEILWSIVRKVIEGTFQDGTLEEKFKYLSISTKSIDFNHVEKAYQKYREILRKNKKISVTDFFKNVIHCLDKVQLKDEKLIVYVDEIQDFSELERRLLFKILKQMKHKSIFITYDMAQKINYTGFNAKLLHSELVEIFPESKISKFELGSVFRCSKEIVELGEAIFPRGKKEASWETGIKPRLLIISSEELPGLLENLKKYKSVMFIDFEGKHRKIFDYDNIYFNYYDVKGLESEIVVLINPFTLSENEYKFREKLYMSITRARRYLYIISTKRIKKEWMNKIRDKVVELVKPEDVLSEIDEISSFLIDDYYLEVLRNDSMANYIISLFKSGKENEEYLAKNFALIKDRLIESGGYEYVEKILLKSGKKEELAHFLLNYTDKYEEAIKLFSELQKFEIAGDICLEKLGDYWRAKSFFAKADNWEKYIQVCQLNKEYEEAGDIYLEKLRAYTKAKEMYKKVENWKKYTKACELNKEYDEAGDVYLKKVKNYVRAKVMFEKVKNWDKYAQACKLNKDYNEAGNVYLEKLRNYLRAKEMFEKAENWQKYADACELNKEYEEAVQYYIKAENYSAAGDIYLNKFKDYTKAKEMYKKAENWQKYAAVSELNEEYEEAGDIYLNKLKNYKKAKKMYKKVENWEKYARACELNEDYNEAIQYYIKVGSYTAAGNIYLEKLNDYDKAKEMYKMAENWEKYARACEMLKDYENATYYYFKAKNYQKAHDTFIKSNLFARLNEISSNKLKNFILLSLGLKQFSYEEEKIIKAFKTASLKINKEYPFFKYF